MSDGGVACMPLQQHIMERLPNVEQTLCGGKIGNEFNAKLLKLADSERKMKMKKRDPEKKVEVEKNELVLDRVTKSFDEIENGEIYGEKLQRDDVEEGELVTLKCPRSELENGEFVPDKPRRSEIENGEIVNEEWKKEELEKGRTVYRKWRKGNVAKGETVPDMGRKGEAEKGEYGSRRGIKDDLENGEFIPDRWHRGEGEKDEHGFSRTCGHQFSKDRGWKCERERTPPSGRYTCVDFLRKKEFNRSGSQHAKSAPRWDSGRVRNIRISSKVVNEGKNEHSKGRNHVSDSSGSRLKMHGNDSDISERKHGGDYVGLKSRRLSDNASRSVCSEHYSRCSVERSYRNSSSSSSSSSKTSVNKYSRHHESSLLARPAYDRHGPSPGRTEWSPHGRGRYYDHKDHKSVHRESSPYLHDRSPYRRERSLHGREKSPYDRNRSRKITSSTHFEQSPPYRGRPNGCRDWTPSLVERSPLDRIRQSSHQETSCKVLASENHNSEGSLKEDKDKKIQRESDCSVKGFEGERNVHDTNGSIENNGSSEPENEQNSCSPAVPCKESPHFESAPDELPSMEEDMDICDTPPHDPVMVESSSGKWFYLDYSGAEHGPSKLYEIRALVDKGVLMSDHFIKHLDGDRWFTVENAASPLAAQNFLFIVPDTITKLVSPPEAPGNFLAVSGDILQSGSENYQEMLDPLLQPLACPADILVASEPLEDLHIDERVGALLENYDVTPGMELEAIKEALQMNFEYAKWEGLGVCEGFLWYDACMSKGCDSRNDLVSQDSEPWSIMSADKDNGFAFGVPGDWFSARWSCKGGDWKQNKDAQDIFIRKKLVLNDGFPLCQMPMSGCEDPRWPQKDDLCSSPSMKLDIPFWAFFADERVECSAMSRSIQSKPAFVRGVKGNVLPVVRINACVVNDQGSLVSEPCHRIRGKDSYQSRSTWPVSLTSDNKRSSIEDVSQLKTVNGQGSCRSMEFIKTPKDHLCTIYDLQVHLGDWYYLDGSGRERGPSSFSELQSLVDQGIIKKYSSVFRKCDKLWVPVTSALETSDVNLRNHQEITSTFGEPSGLPFSQTQGVSICDPLSKSSLFNSIHPQFVGYTCGKLHELVMKSYKSREFAAAINEVLDPWINARQPKQELEKQMYRKSEVDSRAAKRSRMLVDDGEEDSEMEDFGLTIQKDGFTFEDLCGDGPFFRGISGIVDSDVGCWGLLDGHTLARVFHSLRSDLISLAFASMTCKHWRAVVRFYKELSRQVNLSSFGPSCTDSMLWNIMNGYEKDKIRSIILMGCTNITAAMLEKILLSFTCLSKIDIRGCSQFGELTPKFSNVKWIKSLSSHITKIPEEPHKIRTLKWISEQTSSVSKNSSLGTMDDFGELKEYFNSVDKRDTSRQLFRQNLYKRSKLYDARRSSSILSRDARTRRWAIKKSENGYRRMEEFLSSSLREIMKTNSCDFFVPKVAEIEAKIKIGYYSSHGLSSLKEDISRMCRDAIKAKNRGDAGDMNHIIALFVQLATRLEKSFKSAQDRDALLKSWENELCFTFSKYKKNRLVTERKYKSTGTPGGFDNGEYASKREIRRCLSKLNKQSMGSESETSDDLDRSSKDDDSNSETTTSDTESDQEVHSGYRTAESKGDGYFTPGEGLDFITDYREWGARMTKASLVPPVTRKYEVIDHYVIVADEEDVQRKMWVSLPDDYAEKLNAQKNGTEESDMELPEVKDYKPRKQLGDEVIEQEVYGIDPYTHNLLLDSMPEEHDWPLQEKHLFIEDMLLRTLNKKVSHFTGTGNTPMSYPLQPVIEEIKKCAEEDCDARTVRMCQGFLKAIEGRPYDKYVAYRKGLGVVCNKEGGFGEDDFIVEFLGEVYPVWKWFEKQDGVRSLQKDSTDPAPEFYNIYLERPKGDADGYDLVVVDAMHKANYASRICHSCRPNCEAKVTAVDGRYLIGIYSVRKIQHGEEITFDYNSVTESKEEYEASVCLCGSQVCRGSYLNLTGEGAFQKVLKEWHGILDRHHLMLEACELNLVSEEDYNDLGRAGLGSCLLGGLPDWLVAYVVRLVRFINFERTKLPKEILRHNLEEKRKYLSDICLEVERSDAEVQAEGVYNQRLQNLAVTLDKVRYVMRCVFGDPRRAPPPLEKLSPEAAVSFLWKGEGSFVEELLQCMAPHVEEDTLNYLKSKIHAHDPLSSGDIQKELQNSLLWLRDEVRNLPCTYKCRHDAAADLIHIYAYTKCFFRIQGYETITSPPVYISPLDLGPKYADKLGAGVQEFRKAYGENYCLGQLIFWYNQINVEPDCSLARASRGCLSLPDIGSFYAKVQKPSRDCVYGPGTVRSMLARMEKQPQRPWPKDRIWTFKSTPKFFGSPMLDAVIFNSSLDREMVQWLKHRPAIFQAM